MRARTSTAWAPLYHLVTNRPPARPTNVSSTRPTWLRPCQINPALPESVQQAILAAMQPHPKDRPASVAAWRSCWQARLSPVRSVALQTTPNPTRMTWLANRWYALLAGLLDPRRDLSSSRSLPGAKPIGRQQSRLAESTSSFRGASRPRRAHQGQGDQPAQQRQAAGCRGDLPRTGQQQQVQDIAHHPPADAQQRPTHAVHRSRARSPSQETQQPGQGHAQQGQQQSTGPDPSGRLPSRRCRAMADGAGGDGAG